MSTLIDTVYNFTKQANSDQLSHQLNTFCAQMNVEEDGDLALVSIETIDDAVSIWFNQVLSENAESQLNDLIDAYVFEEQYVPDVDQAQIDTLVGYLNNADATIAALARKVIVLNIAPKLGAEMIASINTQIAALLA